MSILPENNANVFATSLLISYCGFSSVILSLIVMINFCIVSERFFSKRKEWYDGRVVWITKNEYGSIVDFLQRFIKS